VGIAIPAAASVSAHTGKKTPVAASHPPPPSLAEQVQALQAKFPDAYGGQETTQAGDLVIYVAAAPHAAEFLAAVQKEAALHRGQRYTVAHVAHSWTQLEDLANVKIAGDTPKWRRHGIALGRWGPQAALNKVVIELRSPSAAAEKALLAAYGSDWVTVSPQPFTMKLEFKDRYYDRAPFYGGDAIFPDPSNPFAFCTDSFTVRNSNGYIRQLTAGHCYSRHPWYTNFYSKYVLGDTSGNYYSGFGGNTYVDIQHVYANATDYVWGNSTTLYHPFDTYTPDYSDGICFDGAHTGEVCDATVTYAGPFCEIVGGYNDCWLGEAHKSSVVCQGGDSGGPVYQRTSTAGEIKAVGSISAGTPDGTYCDYTQMSAIESRTGVTLDTG
jgi:hypothetical protein